MHFKCLIPPAHVIAICDNDIEVRSYGPIDEVMYGSIGISNSDEKIIAIHFHQMSRAKMLHGLTQTVKIIRSMRNTGKWDGQAVPCSFSDQPNIISISRLILGPVTTTRISVRSALGIEFGI